MPGGVVEDDALCQELRRVPPLCRFRVELASMALRASASVARRSSLRRLSFSARSVARGVVLGEEEFDDIGGDVHAAGGVDAGREAEADFGGGGSAINGDLRELA